MVRGRSWMLLRCVRSPRPVAGEHLHHADDVNPRHVLAGVPLVMAAVMRDHAVPGEANLLADTLHRGRAPTPLTDRR